MSQNSTARSRQSMYQRLVTPAAARLPFERRHSLQRFGAPAAAVSPCIREDVNCSARSSTVCVNTAEAIRFFNIDWIVLAKPCWILSRILCFVDKFLPVNIHGIAQAVATVLEDPRPIPQGMVRL